MKKQRFKIDFFEFSFLVEACIPPNPIARSMFWKDVIDKHYHDMTSDERERLWNWINMNPSYKQGLEKEEEDCLLFEARFNPNNQYLLTTNYEDKIETYECFYWKDRYYTSSNMSILEEYIKEIKKIEPKNEEI